MANGRPGDHPLSDFLVHGYRVFPEDINVLLDQIIAIDPEAFETAPAPTHGPLPHHEYLRQFGDWWTWMDGSDIEAARRFLHEKLELAKRLTIRRDADAERVAAAIHDAFPGWLRQKFAYTHPLDDPNPDLAGVRVPFDAFVFPFGEEFAGVNTYPHPVVWRTTQDILASFEPGDADGVVAKLRELAAERPQ